MNVSPATTDDAPSILALQHLAYQTEAARYDDNSLPPLLETQADLLARFRDRRFLKAVEDNEIIGSVRGFQEADTCFVERLIVHPDCRCRGIGTTLLTEIGAIFPTARRFELFTGTKSESNIRLYERLGYRAFRQEWVNEKVALVFMEKVVPRLTIRLDRLELIAATKEMLEAEEDLERLDLRAEVPANWPTPLYDNDARQHFLRVVSENSDAVGWTAWYILLFDGMGKRTLIGAVGEVLWRRNLETEYGVEQFCFNASPLMEGRLLILCIGSYGGGSPSCVLALDKDSGKEVWKTPTEGLTNSSPIAISAGGKRQVIVWTQKAVMSLDPMTGKIYWEEPTNTMAQNAVATPVFDKGLLLVSGLMLKLDPGQPAASVLWPETKASSRRVLSNTSTPVILGDHVFSAKLSGGFVCLEASTGREVWQTDKVTERRNGTSAHVTPHGDAVFIFTDTGDLIRARLASDSYQEISRIRLIEPTYPYAGRKVAWPPPAYANRHVFARNDKELICVSLAATP